MRDLRYFVAVAEEQSFTRAAIQRPFISQPALSKQIRQLGPRTAGPSPSASGLWLAAPTVEKLAAYLPGDRIEVVVGRRGTASARFVFVGGRPGPRGA